MASIFTKIIDGELPGRFVWQDERVVAFLTVAPLKPGHTLVVPREEIDHWIDLAPSLNQRMAHVAQCIGKAVQAGFDPVKVGTIVLGLEVPHVHIHVVPIWSPTDLDFGNADHRAKDADLDAAAETIRSELRKLGHAEVSE